MKRKTLTKTEKLNEAREKRLKENLSPREEKQNLWEKRINTWEKYLLISAMFASSWQMAAKCVKQKYHCPIMKM